MSTDAIVLLKDEHQQIRKTFRAFEKAGERAHATKGRLVDKMIELLTIHTYIENEVMYPRVRELLPEVEDDVLESYEEHHVADVLVMELSTMKPEDERFTAKTTVLIENVEHHMEEEEKEWFPQVRAGLGRNQLQDLGRQLIQAREKAPRRPSQPGALKKTVKAVLD
ncbi:MAG TPA: hemerythrin domain-containing protein [Nocardioides sp.]|jgi:hemerythrin-like domain-containing protein|nr:hemerythrin domain-containing protein [Nocardioides sp.]